MWFAMYVRYKGLVATPYSKILHSSSLLCRESLEGEERERSIEVNTELTIAAQTSAPGVKNRTAMAVNN